MNRRQTTVQQLEDLGVVAVIRMKEPEKLRDVVDAIAAGGVRALEVTMTVPGAVDLIRALAPTLPTASSSAPAQSSMRRPPRR